MKAYIFLANGFEEMEVTYPISILRTAGIEIESVSIEGTKSLVGSHGVNIITDSLFTDKEFKDADMIILPGGQPGTDKLDSFIQLKDLITYYSKNKSIAAICAAPSILGKMGV